MIKFRYDIQEGHDEHGKYWMVYKFSDRDRYGLYVGQIYDKETLELLAQAPAMRRLMDDQKKFGMNPRMALRRRNYTERRLRDYALSFFEFFKRL